MLYKNYIKRLLDIVLSFCALIVLSPVFIVLIIVGAIKVKGNPFFTQTRVGLNEKLFTLIKFRSMTNEKDANGELLPDEVRLIPYGKFIRETSLDEIPEFINVLKGDMSIIGPRPLLESFLPKYNEVQRHRHDVMPGITGLAMATVRNAATWERKFELDIEYVNNLSFCLDVKIFFMTIGKVLSREGINEEGYISSSDFMGSEENKWSQY